MDSLSPIENISFYRFVRIESNRLPSLRAELKEVCLRHGLRGSILLSTEGINGFIAGLPGQLAQLKDFLHADPHFPGLDFKISFSATIPFRRMLVKLKKEIIPMGRESIDPPKMTAPRLEPEELKRWLDEGRPVHLLDTRNEFEISLGTFRGARSLGLKTFREFTARLEKEKEALAGVPTVMFCTGGIRCEKAGALALELGMTEVYQLEGGILRYFEKVGGAHYDGGCFVFDRRVALDPALQPTGDVLCYGCRTVLKTNDLDSPLYHKGESCPHCASSSGSGPSGTTESRVG